LPETKRTLQAAYQSMGDAGKTVSKVFEIGILPVALEILDKTFINSIEDYTQLGLPRGRVQLVKNFPEGNPISVLHPLPLLDEALRGEDNIK